MNMCILLTNKLSLHINCTTRVFTVITMPVNTVYFQNEASLLETKVQGKHFKKNNKLPNSLLLWAYGGVNAGKAQQQPSTLSWLAWTSTVRTRFVLFLLPKHVGNPYLPPKIWCLEGSLITLRRRTFTSASEWFCKTNLCFLPRLNIAKFLSTRHLENVL